MHEGVNRIQRGTAHMFVLPCKLAGHRFCYLMPVDVVTIDDSDGEGAPDVAPAMDSVAPSGSAELQNVEDELHAIEVQIGCLLRRQELLHAQHEQLLRISRRDARAPKARWSGSFPWDAQVLALMTQPFSIPNFRPLQREVLNATLQGRDVLCLLPSGGGKSLCYQLPALLSTGITLVVSPLLALIQDQVYALHALGVEALALTSLTPKDEMNTVFQQLDSPTLKLVYVTPERVVSSKRFMGKLEKLNAAGRLSRIAIDEAHCCSSYGNDFRPDYKKLGMLKQQFPDTPIIALTATATDQVVRDLTNILRIEGCELFRTSVNRPNLYYEVRQKPSPHAELTAAIVAIIHEHYADGESGIVYALTRKECEQLATELKAEGIKAAYYHADMQPSERDSVHRDWSDGLVQCIVATVAFGMGVNHTAVRWVIHHSPSKSIENYYQESGRAGRDGLPARCILFYRFADILRQAGIVCYEPSWEGHLMAMMRYACNASGCRRAAIQAHFAEAPAVCRGMCDCCCAALDISAATVATAVAAGSRPQESQLTQLDISQHAVALLKILQALEATSKKATLNQLLDAWKSPARAGAAAATAAKALSMDMREAVVGHLLALGLLSLEFGHTAYSTNVYLRVSPRGAQLLAASAAANNAADGGVDGGGSSSEMGSKSSGKGAKGSSSTSKLPQLPPLYLRAVEQQQDDVHVRLQDREGADPATRLNALLEWRQSVAESLAVFPDCVLSPAQLVALSRLTCMPSNADMEAVICPKQMQEHGQQLRQCLQQLHAKAEVEDVVQAVCMSRCESAAAGSETRGQQVCSGHAAQASRCAAEAVTGCHRAAETASTKAAASTSKTGAQGVVAGTEKHANTADAGAIEGTALDKVSSGKRGGTKIKEDASTAKRRR